MRVEVEINPNEKHLKELKTIYDYFLERNKPMCYNPFDERSILINGEKEFEEMCNSMEDSGIKDAKQSTVFEFYSKVQYLEKKAQRMKSLERKQ